MTKILKAVDEDHLFIFNDGIKFLHSWQQARTEAFWSDEYIDADIVYRMSKPVQRAVEETGLMIQAFVSEWLNIEKTLFPYIYQVVKVKNIFFEKIPAPENKICQSITYLNGAEKGKTFISKPEDNHVFLQSDNEDIYALCILWGDEQNSIYPRWFNSKYLRLHYGQN
jgi:hypothetical protein